MKKDYYEVRIKKKFIRAYIVPCIKWLVYIILLGFGIIAGLRVAFNDEWDGLRKLISLVFSGLFLYLCDRLYWVICEKAK